MPRVLGWLVAADPLKLKSCSARERPIRLNEQPDGFPTVVMFRAFPGDACRGAR